MIDAAPARIADPDCPYDPNDPQAVEAFWKDAVVVHGGGVPAVTAALEERRRTRGPNKRPTKEQVAIRLSPEVLAAFRADGPGWQTRVDEALKDWIKTHRTPPGN
jgi:uncharacterized protein (DUF4415 family)